MTTIRAEHRAALSTARRRELDAGRPLFGGAAGKERQRASASARKGKTYADIYGPERAAEEARKRRDGNRARWEGVERAPSHPRQGSDHLYDEWRRAVLARDDYTCRRCGVRGGELHAHHVLSWAEHPEARYDVANGLTLHPACHREHHRENPRTTCHRGHSLADAYVVKRGRGGTERRCRPCHSDEQRARLAARKEQQP